jgi:MFS family permease
MNSADVVVAGLRECLWLIQRLWPYRQSILNSVYHECRRATRLAAFLFIPYRPSSVEDSHAYPCFRLGSSSSLYGSFSQVRVEVEPSFIELTYKHSFSGLVATRFLLGLFEAGCLPLFSVITAQWYRRSEQPLRVAAWYSTNGLATIFAAILSFGL